jgi:dTDP-4-amino-4,6-dideoxygalactose transaminase
MGGRVALSAAIYALDLQPGDEVVIPGYTCVVVPNAFEYAGVKPIYADIELETYGLSAESLRGRITPKTKAVLLHHLFGLVCRDYDAILEIARLHDLKVIEDCAHATGATYKGIRVGNTGDIAFYSSETSKVFNTIQGGMVVTGSDVIAEKLRQYHRQAPEPSSGRIDSLLHNVLLNYYQFKHRHRWVLGDLYRLRYYRKTLVATTEEELRGVKPAHYGCRMPAPLAALGLNQLRKIDRYIEARRKQAVNWDRWCDANGYARPLVLPGSNPVWLRYPVLVEPEKKSDTSWAMRELGVQPGVWFVSHLHPQQRYIEGCPNADIAVAQCINFPTLV